MEEHESKSISAYLDELKETRKQIKDLSKSSGGAERARQALASATATLCAICKVLRKEDARNLSRSILEKIEVICKDVSTNSDVNDQDALVLFKNQFSSFLTL